MLTDADRMLAEYPVARQKILADFEDYGKLEIRFACKRYYNGSCPLDDVCDCDSGDNTDGYKCSRFEAGVFEDYFRIMDYDELELEELN